MVKSLGLKGKRGGDLRREIQKLLKAGKTVPFPEVYVNRPARGRSTKSKNGRPPAAARTATAARTAKIPGGPLVDLSQYTDPRQALMDWMRSKDNPYFAKAFVNRVWANYFGVGIINPPDDLSLANPPSNAPLVDYLAHGLIEHGFDMKWLHREITNSATYQRSWRTNDTNIDDRRNFSHALPRRIPAEVLYDAVVQATASDTGLRAAHTELAGRAIAVPGTGTRGGQGASQRYALTVFGRSTRESNCDCDRSSDPSLLQTLYLQNDRDIQTALSRKDGWLAQLAAQHGERMAGSPTPPAGYAKMIRSMQNRLRQLRKAGKKSQVRQLQQRLAQATRKFGLPDADSKQGKTTAKVDRTRLIHEAYLRTVSRLPEPEELSAARDYLASAATNTGGLRDIMWALLNTKEFIVNH